MARVQPVDRAAHPELEDVYESYEAMLGYVTNGILTLSHRPEIARAFAALSRAVTGSGTLPWELQNLVAFMANSVVGSVYCQAHCAAALADTPHAAKLAAMDRYETSELFSDAERAALTVAKHAAMIPNQVTDEDMAELREHFDDGEIVEIVASIALFGWLARWQDTMRTELEPLALSSATEVLGPIGWSPGAHAPA